MIPLPASVITARELAERSSNYQARSSSRIEVSRFFGRLAEVSGGPADALTTVASLLIRSAQELGEPVVWVAAGDEVFFPPDMSENGVDLDALPLVRAGDPRYLGRAVDILVRSGAFGMVVADLSNGAALPDAAQAKLSRMAREFRTAVVCLVREVGTLSSMVGLRAQCSRRDAGDGRFCVQLSITRDKGRGEHTVLEEVCRGPDGLR